MNLIFFGIFLVGVIFYVIFLRFALSNIAPLYDAHTHIKTTTRIFVACVSIIILLGGFMILFDRGISSREIIEKKEILLIY